MPPSVLSAIASRCHFDLANATAEYTRAVRQLPGYSLAAIAEEELHRTAYDSLDLMMRLLAGEDVAEQLGARSDSIGRRRAQQGIALDSLARAVRMDFRFLWGVLRDEAHADEVVPLAEEVATIWDVVELHTSRVQTAYIAELSEVNRELERERGSLLRRLVAGEANDPAQLEHIAAMFGFPLDGRFRVAVANPRFSRQFRQALGRLRARPDMQAFDGVELAILDDAALSSHDRELLQQAPAGISPAVEGLGRVAVAWSIARRLAELVDTPDAAATLGSHWQHLVDEGLGPAAVAFRDERLAQLRALPAGRRALLLEGVHAYMRTGSIAETAERLFVHRNTVLKRLNAFTVLTGLDPSVPNDAATIRLLLGGIE
ncbi:PucR family transcriptional regulator [Agrococcus sp. ARC_14]|uniref:PucR family transcriptional regulator n=1 Tax=Agrococcus sp. ARC_14 TaxID=2919927 RepID=UPI001F060557|nr:PucR family transcriptional regulator [Agrococcus sp. ARC_14]MCH1884007.1 helix-turn-helix domain-containing protein [Agrococcus sp. ARC_14]